MLHKNGTHFPLDGEHKFRISSTFAAMNEESVQNFVSVNPLYVSKNGSNVFNTSHLDLYKLAESLEKEVLLIEVGKDPKFGKAEWADETKNTISWTELKTAFHLIYRHHSEETRDDSVMFYVYPTSESARTSSRLRITVPIRITTVRDPEVVVEHFPTSISILNSGTLTMASETFTVTHPKVPPQSIVYEIIQRGRNGVSVRVNEREVRKFTQHQARNEDRR